MLTSGDILAFVEAGHPPSPLTIYRSRDHGRTWQASEPFPVMGTGEACVVELFDGRIFYNSRRHSAPTREEALHRWTARSEDGGAAWKDPVQSSILPDGNQLATNQRSRIGRPIPSNNHGAPCPNEDPSAPN